MIDVAFAAVHLVVHVGNDPEQLVEFAVVGAQQVVQPPLSDQHDLDPERNRFRSQGCRSCKAVHRFRAFDSQLLFEQRPFQCVPHERPAQYVLDVQDEVPAISAEQRPAANHGEIGDKGAHLDPVLDIADDVRVTRIGFVDDGCRR